MARTYELFVDIEQNYFIQEYKDGKPNSDPVKADAAHIFFAKKFNNLVCAEVNLCERLEKARSALRMIAGLEQCIDNTLSNAEIARQALLNDFA